jgi:hypothetical protein
MSTTAQPTPAHSATTASPIPSPTPPSTATSAAAPILESDLDLVVVPITLGLRTGRMRLADGRLSFTRRRRRRVVFDAPVGEFHSVARSSLGTGFHLWHGTRRYRFVAHEPVVPAAYGSSAVADVAEAVTQLHQGLAATVRSRDAVDRWHDALSPLLAPAPPPGTRVRRPMTGRRFVATLLGATIGATALLVAAITAIVVAGS